MQPAYSYCWHGIPFLRLLIPLITGILLGEYFHPAFIPLLITTSVFLLILFLPETLSTAGKYQWRWVSGICINCLLILLGSFLIYLHKSKKDTDLFAAKDADKTYLAVSIEEVLPPGNRSDRYIAALRSQWHKDAGNHGTGKFLLSVRKDSTTDRTWEPGQILLARKLPRPIRDNGNPGSFSFRQYYARQGIHYQLYLNPGEYSISRQIQPTGMYGTLCRIRHFVIQTIRTLIPGEKEQGLAEALLIGYRNDLDKDLVRSYSRMGVVHIIAISGLHLGMIYGLLLLFMRPFQKKKWYEWAKPLLLLSVLWFFTLLAGAAPSILRSALMFSFIIIGESFKRRTHIYHSLTASAFCLLIINPHFLWDTGCQLSYAAVGGIVLLWKPVYKLIYVQNRLLRAIWQMQAITISAQVFTFPLTVYYFHQFPNLFLFTNALAVPLSGYILYGELLVLFFCKIPFLNMYTGKMVSSLIRVLNNFIERSDRLPFALTENIRVGLAETLLLYAILVFLFFALRKKSGRDLVTPLCLVLVLLIYRTVLFYRFHTQNKLILYDLPGREHMDIYKGQQVWVWGADAQKTGDKQKNSILTDSRREHGIEQPFGMAVKQYTEHLYMGPHKTVLYIDRHFQLIPREKKLRADLIILGPLQPYPISRIAAVFEGKQYIFSAGNPLWKIQYWKKEADSLHLRHHTISEQGAFEMDL